jgi:transposase
MGPRPKVSMASWCCYRPDGSAARLSFHVREGSFNDQALIGVLGRVRRLLGGAAVTLVWDNLPAHHSRRMHAFLAGQGDWLQVEYLPAYAPELNPVEGVWASLKDRELANLGAETLKVLLGAARRGLRRVQRERWLLRGFLDHCGLALG